MTDNERDLAPLARVFVIGVIQLSDDPPLELRCVREPWGWRPDILVNHETEVVCSPPPCFELNEEALGLLDRALYAVRKGDGSMNSELEGWENEGGSIR